LRILLRSWAVQASTPLVSLRKLSAASAGIAGEDPGPAFACGGERDWRRERGVTMELSSCL
jgi:hypothetical protein